MRQPLNVHLQQLAYLREVARGPTFAAAAARLRVSQPALSQGLRELERRLSVTLFERVGRRRRLTQIGEETLALARSLLAQAESFAGRLEARERGEGGMLRVGMIDAASLYLLPGAVRAFRRQHADVELRLTVDSSANLLAALADFDLDLAFVVGPLPAEAVKELRLIRLVREALFLYAPQGARETPEREWALYPRASNTRALIDRALGRLGIEPRVILESGEPQVLRQMVALGLAWSVLPAAVAEVEPSLRRWRRRPLTHRELLAAWRREAALDLRAERFLALARRPVGRRGYRGGTS